MGDLPHDGKTRPLTILVLTRKPIAFNGLARDASNRSDLPRKMKGGFFRISSVKADVARKHRMSSAEKLRLTARRTDINTHLATRLAM